MTYTELPAMPNAAVPVFRDLSPITGAEYLAKGVSNYEALDSIRSLICGKRGYALCKGAEIIAVYGFVLAEGATYTWFAAARPVFRGGGATRFLARRMDDHARRIKGPILSVTTSPHPKVVRWFDLLGFDISETHKTHKVFAYRRDKPVPPVLQSKVIGA